MEIDNTLKALWSMVWACLASTIYQIGGEVFVLVILFLVNFIFGLLAGILIQGETWSFKKSFLCVFEAMVFILIVAGIYIIGYLKHNPTGATWCVSIVSYSILYWYTLNILKNLKRLFPSQSIGYRVSAFLYWLLSVEFIKKVPYLEKYINGESIKEEEK